MSKFNLNNLIPNIWKKNKKIFSRYYWWQIALFFVGIIALLSVIGALFVASGSSPKQLYTNGPVPDVTDSEFRDSLSRILNIPVEQGGSIKILNNGDEFYPALDEALENAKRTINFSVYIWQDGEASSKIMNRLLEKQKSGVQVRVLQDGLGSKSSPEDQFEELEQAGAKIETFRGAEFGKLTRFHRRNHRRSIVIDGQTGFIGGMAVSDSWLGHAQDPEHWRDLMFQVTGPMARSLQSAFVDHWASSSGEMLIGEDIFPNTFPENSDNSITFMHLVSSPADDSQPLPQFLMLSMQAAKQKLYITTPYFIGNRNLMTILSEKAKSGVDVRLILPGKEIDNKMSRWGAQNSYHDLLKSGVKIYEYQPTFIHSKFIVVDDELSLIGSPNLNSRSQRLDEENIMAIFDKELAGDLMNIFNEDMKSSQEITLSEWRKRNPFVRVLQLISRLIAQQS